MPRYKPIRSMDDHELGQALTRLIVAKLLHDEGPEMSTRDQAILREYMRRSDSRGMLSCVCEDCVADWIDPWEEGF